MGRAARYPSPWADAAADRATAELPCQTFFSARHIPEAEEEAEEAEEAEAEEAEAAEAAEAAAEAEADVEEALTPLATRWLCRAAIHSRATRGRRRKGTARLRRRSGHDDRDDCMHMLTTALGARR